MKIDELINKNYDKLTQNDHQIFNYIIMISKWEK